MSDYHIIIENTTFDHGSTVVHNEHKCNESAENSAILQELENIQKELGEAEPLIANILAELQKAIKEQNQSKITNMLKLISTGYVASFLANIASGSLLTFLGIK